MKPDRYADLWITDFLASPDEVALMFPMRPFLVGSKGKPTGLQGRSAQRNLIIFRHGFTRAVPWTEAIDGLIQDLGGWEEVERLVNGLPDARRLIRLTLPIRNSPHQENDFIAAEILGRLAGLRIDLGIEFGNYQLGDDQQSVAR